MGAGIFPRISTRRRNGRVKVLLVKRYFILPFIWSISVQFLNERFLDFVLKIGFYFSIHSEPNRTRSCRYVPLRAAESAWNWRYVVSFQYFNIQIMLLLLLNMNSELPYFKSAVAQASKEDFGNVNMACYARYTERQEIRFWQRVLKSTEAL